MKFRTNVSPHSADQVELCGRQWQKIWNFLENHKKFKFRLIIICGFIFIMFKLEWYLVKARLSRSSRRSHNNIFFSNQTPFHDDCFASLNWQAINQNYVLCWSHELFDVFFFFGDLCSSLCASLRSIISTSAQVLMVCERVFSRWNLSDLLIVVKWLGERARVWARRIFQIIFNLLQCVSLFNS